MMDELPSHVLVMVNDANPDDGCNLNDSNGTNTQPNKLSAVNMRIIEKKGIRLLLMIRFYKKSKVEKFCSNYYCL